MAASKARVKAAQRLSSSGYEASKHLSPAQELKPESKILELYLAWQLMLYLCYKLVVLGERAAGLMVHTHTQAELGHILDRFPVQTPSPVSSLSVSQMDGDYCLCPRHWAKLPRSMMMSGILHSSASKLGDNGQLILIPV